MSGPYSIAREHLQAAMTTAEAEGIDPERMGKALLSELFQVLLVHRSAEDVRAEVGFELDNLSRDEEFHFMRP